MFGIPAFGFWDTRKGIAVLVVLSPIILSLAITAFAIGAIVFACSSSKWPHPGLFSYIDIFNYMRHNSNV